MCKPGGINGPRVLVYEFHLPPRDPALPVDSILCPFERLFEFYISGNRKEDADTDRSICVDDRVPDPSSGYKNNKDDSDEPERFLFYGYHTCTEDGPGIPTREPV